MTEIKKEKKLHQIKDTLYVSYKVLQLIWITDPLLLIGSFIAVLIPAITPFGIAYIFKLIIDQIVLSLTSNKIDFNQIAYLILALLLMQYINRMAFSFQNYTQRLLFLKLPITLYQLVLEKISKLDLKYFEDSKFRDTLQKVRESYDFRPLSLANNIFFLSQSVAQVAIALYAILKLNPILAFVSLLVAVPDLYNQLYFSKLAWGIWGQNVPYRKKYEYLSDLLQRAESIKELKIFLISKRFLKELFDIQYKFFQENRSVARKQLGVNSIFNLFDTLVMGGIAVYVILEAFARRITIGDINFYQTVIGNFNNGIGGIFRTLSQVFDHSLYVKSVFELLDVKSEITSPLTPIKIDFNKAPTIEFKNVTFSYPGTTTKIFKNFSILINPGEKIALVGENGAGKTTLIKLLARFYDVDEGEILINGTNLKNLHLESWYKTLGILFQDFIKYEYPVKDNIYFGRIWEKEDLEKIIKASISSGADEMIKKFDKQYNQMLGRIFEGGIEPSGGQWQKVALARAFFRNAPVLVLDEPTAAIDAKAESEIFNRVEKLSKQKTVIIISHRFSTVRNADKIYVVENGNIIESGTHEQLMRQNKQYATLFKLQAKGYQ